MITLRRVLIFVFAAAYFALCPPLVFHVLRILRTGLIEVTSEPSSASVSLNGRPVEGTTPLTVRELSPGVYNLSVSAPGHRTWTNSVTVKQGQATALKRVLLLPDDLPVRELADTGFDRMVAIEQAPFFLLAAGNTVATWRVFDLQNESFRPLLPPDSPMAAASVKNVFTAPRSSRFVLHIVLDGTPRFLRVNPATEPHRIDDLSTHFPEPPERVLWDAVSEDVLFSFRSGNVRKIDLRLGKDDPNFGTDWRGLGVFDQRVFRMEPQGRITSTKFDKSSEETIFDDPKASREIFGEEGAFSIWPLDPETILFRGANGRLCQSGLPNVLVEKGVRDVRVDVESSRALVWTAHQLGMLEASAAVADETERFQKGRQVTWVFENAEDIRDAWCVDGGSHAVIQNGGRLELLELLAGVQARPREIVGVASNSGIRYDDQRGVVYALERKQGRLIAVRIAPARSLLAPASPRRSP